MGLLSFLGNQGLLRGQVVLGLFHCGPADQRLGFYLGGDGDEFQWVDVCRASGKIFTDGLPYAFASFYALTIPLTGVLFLRRQWVLGQAFRYVTPGEMYSDIFGGSAIRILTVIVAFLFSVPYLGVQLKASGSLFSILTDDWVSVNLGMYALTTVVVVYVASGGLRSVAYVIVPNVFCWRLALLRSGLLRSSRSAVGVSSSRGCSRSSRLTWPRAKI